MSNADVLFADETSDLSGGIPDDLSALAGGGSRAKVIRSGGVEPGGAAVLNPEVAHGSDGLEAFLAIDVGFELAFFVELELDAVGEERSGDIPTFGEVVANIVAVLFRFGEEAFEALHIVSGDKGLVVDDLIAVVATIRDAVGLAVDLHRGDHGFAVVFDHVSRFFRAPGNEATGTDEGTDVIVSEEDDVSSSVDILLDFGFDIAFTNFGLEGDFTSVVGVGRLEGRDDFFHVLDVGGRAEIGDVIRTFCLRGNVIPFVAVRPAGSEHHERETKRHHADFFIDH